MKKIIIYTWLVFFLILLNMGQAATFTVTKTADTNDGTCDADCSLREAIITANAAAGADVITLPAGTYILSIAGPGEIEAATGDLNINDDLTINGADSSTTVIDGGGLDRVFQLSGFTPPIMAIQEVTIQNGLAVAGGGISIAAGANLIINRIVVRTNKASVGGGIRNDGTLSVRNCTFFDNEATGNGVGGGAIHNAGVLTVESSTFENNDALLGQGGAIKIVELNASLNIENSTFTGNGAQQALYVGGGTVIVNNCTFAGNVRGVAVVSGSMTISNTIIADSDPATNCSGTFTSGGHNLSSDNSCAANLTGPGDLNNTDPVLGALADNGGPTRTHALLTGSPAIDAGDNVGCSSTDQRGFVRPKDGDRDCNALCDIGAYEFALPAGEGCQKSIPSIPLLLLDD